MRRNYRRRSSSFRRAVSRAVKARAIKRAKRRQRRIRIVNAKRQRVGFRL